MKDTYILAIESSCDETSMAIIKNGLEDVATVILSQMDTHASYGGVVPEIASRMHVESITMVLDETLKKAGITLNEIENSSINAPNAAIFVLSLSLMESLFSTMLRAPINITNMPKTPRILAKIPPI